MLRFPYVYSASVFLLAFGASLFADPAPATKLDETLAVQRAMEQAKLQLFEGHSKQAVDTLEEQLSRADGNPRFLKLLRDAYRVHIKDLFAARQNELAQRYIQRLSILDPQAAREWLEEPRRPAPIVEAKVAPTKQIPLPSYGSNHEDLYDAPKKAIPSAVRAKGLAPQDDPFDPTNQRRAPVVTASRTDSRIPQQLATQAEDAFGRRKYAEARGLYEKAIDLDRTLMERCRDKWAYCVMSDVVENLNRSPSSHSLSELKRQVNLAMDSVPSLQPTGQWLLREIDQRSRTQISAAAPDASLAEPSVQMTHYGRNPQGWMVTETSHFRIFHNQPREMVEQVAQIAERTRVEMARKWFGNETGPWDPKCELVLHATAADYSKQTGVSATSPGHSRIESDPSSFRVISRRMDLRCDNPGMLEAVLPHETTHVVLAGQFGAFVVPRWADEGMAVLSEPADKIEMHRRNLMKSVREQQAFPLKDLMQLQDYPAAGRIQGFYAQSVILVDFLVQQRGPVVCVEFIRDGLRGGYEPSLRKHYGWSMDELQQRWNQHLSGEMQRLAGR
ncbi:MAG: hypothetical protein K2X38_15010 [Gemmataceae bacterium]|nr:hypothetical protein [Gemmataceae bacterium]